MVGAPKGRPWRQLQPSNPGNGMMAPLPGQSDPAGFLNPDHFSHSKELDEDELTDDHLFDGYDLSDDEDTSGDDEGADDGICEHQDLEEQLEGLAIAPNLLRKAGYILEPLNAKQLEQKKRCSRCGKFMNTGKGKAKPSTAQPAHTGGARNTGPKSIKLKPFGGTKVEKPKMKCRYHPGAVNKGFWTCCRQHVSKPFCVESEDHQDSSTRQDHFRLNWKFFSTPIPTMENAGYICPAVAIDCEMGVAKSGDSELIRVSVVDFETREVLLDKLVWPDCAMLHMNTKFSGVARWQMEQARKNRTCLFGRAAARTAVWKFVSPKTIIIGHALHNDLTALRWIHDTIIDTYLLPQFQPAPPKPKEESDEAEGPTPGRPSQATGATHGSQLIQTGNQAGNQAGNQIQGLQAQNGPNGNQQKKRGKPKGSGPLSLKTLARTKLGREIQKGKGHDSVEDAMAARDLVQWVLENPAEDAQPEEPARDLIQLDSGYPASGAQTGKQLLGQLRQWW